MPAPQADPAVPASPALEPDLLAAAGRRQGDRLPVWFMRQAGRSLPEYHQIRAGLGMLETCARPELVTEITLQPVRRYGVDGAVLYSDIVVPLRAVGIGLEIKPGIGPVIEEPIRTRADLDRLQPLDPAAVSYVAESVRLLVAELGDTPLIGFAGAPFTLASYLVEGGPSKDYARTKALMAGDPGLWHDLCGRLAGIAADFLAVQIGAGARIVQLFDSWVGSLSLADYQASVAEHSARVLTRARDLGVPTIHFGVGTGELLPAMASAGADVVGVDWRIPLAEASRRIGPDHAVQGNLDPALLGAPWPVIAARVREVINSGAQAPGHIFNLGHGVPPTTDPDVLAKIVDLVHVEGPALRAEASR